MSLGHSLGEYSWILSVEKKVDSCEFTVLVFLIIPNSCVDVSFKVVGVDKDRPPMTTPLIIEPQAFTRNRTESSCLWIITVLDPLIWKTAVVFSIIKWLKGEPISLVFLKILIIDALKS